jgi:hypothetical protein
MPCNKTPRNKAPTLDLASPINPAFTYRLNGAVVAGVIGLGPTQRDEAIKKGLLPRPVPLLPGGRSKAYTGQQLLDIQARRTAEAEAPRKREQASEQPEVGTLVATTA